MTFNFNTNQFINNKISTAPFIIGTDISLTQNEAYNLHLTLKNILLDLQIPKGHPICIYGEKEALFPIVMITLIALDIPYIPIDAIMPSGRIKNIQQQTESKVLINCTNKNCDVEFDICIANNFQIIKNKTNIIFPVINGNSSDPIRYILFTSGSTGTPKGVQITANALNSFVNWFVTWPEINTQTVFMNQAPFSFDVSLCDFIGTFACGATLVLNNYTILKSGNPFLERLKKFKANTIICTPSFIKMYVSVPDFNEDNYPELTQIIFMGEELLASTVRKIKSKFPKLKVVNAYGPTEATVVVTYIQITDDILNKYSTSLPIGYCRPNAELVVLNKDVNSGIGELGLIGNNLSIGYFNDIEKTNQAFIFENEKRIYKTGDVGYIKDDLVFYCGRNDNQVKLNGYRIELDEITSMLLMHPHIINASTIPLTKDGTAKKIISFIVVDNNVNEAELELKSYLLINLPSYMIPSEFIILKEFPLNSNYKTDKKALLDLYLSNNV